MARPKGYQRDEVLEAAMNTFWEYGYEATSLSKLTDRTGLNKKSLYNEFGSKAELFQTVLEHYQKTMLPHHNWLLKQPESPENVIEFFESIAQDTYERPNGCLLTLSLNEIHQLEEPNVEFVHGHYTALEQKIYKNLSANPSLQDAQQLAQYLTSSILGLSSWIRLAPSKEQYYQIIQMVIEPLKNRLS